MKTLWRDAQGRRRDMAEVEKFLRQPERLFKVDGNKDKPFKL